MNLHRKVCAIAIASLSTLGTLHAGEAPTVEGWIISGSAAGNYMARRDGHVSHSGLASGSLFAITKTPRGVFGTLMQNIDARPLAGKRVRFAAYVRAAGVTTGAALWMRVDSDKGDVLAFDNMWTRGWIRSDCDWVLKEIVLDVPRAAKLLAFGILLQGEGIVWIDTATLETVSAKVPTTNPPVQVPRHAAPGDDLRSTAENLGFED